MFTPKVCFRFAAASAVFTLPRLNRAKIQIELTGKASNLSTRLDVFVMAVDTVEMSNYDLWVKGKQVTRKIEWFRQVTLMVPLEYFQCEVYFIAIMRLIN